MQKELIQNRYELHDVIGKGAMGIIYRAYDRLDNQLVALKRVQVSPANLQIDSKGKYTSASRDYLTALTQEFQVLSYLRHPNIISVLDYGFDSSHNPFFVMELLEEADNFIDAGQNASLEKKVNYIVQLLRSLEYLHRRGIVHRDLKPANVLVSHNETVKVLDFGLAIARHQVTEANQLVGTLAYMSPEAIENGNITELSDLYAVGVMVYEILLNKHPFDTSNLNKLLASILNQTVDISPIQAINSGLAHFLSRLLEKDPYQRYRSAYQAIVELAELSEMPIPAESIAVRESFLRSAHLVGRDKEVKELVEALAKMSKGESSIWFLAGESGIGKSRLIEEIRTRAQIDGAIVLIGQAQEDSEHPYQIWREPLRRMLIIDDLVTEDELSILKAFIPDLEKFMGRSIIDAPSLSGRAELNRLSTAIADILKRLAKLENTLLVLEDLHWATESIAPLQQLLSDSHELKLMTLSSYRSDESPNLPDSLLNSNVIHLKRLDSADTAILAQSMIGKAGKSPKVIELLQRETEGNLYFLVEVVRALAEDAGNLENIGLVTLPSTVLSGDIQKVVMRRLERVPEDAKVLLNIAAVLGRNLDLEVLRELSKLSQDAFDNWLVTCSDAAVIQVLDGQWRFVHEKLRQGILSLIPDDEKKEFHRIIADTIEKISANIQRQAMILVEHFAAADMQSKVQVYAPIAAAQAHRACLYQDVLRFVNLIANPNPDLLKLKGDAYEGLGNYKEAQQQYEKVLAHADVQAKQKVAAYNGLSAIAWRTASYNLAVELAQKALELGKEIDDKFGLATALNNLGICASDRGQFSLAQTYYEEGLALRREISDLQGEGYILNSLGFATIDQQKYLKAAEYFQQAAEVAASIGDKHEFAFAKHGVSMALCLLGEHDDAIYEAKAGLHAAHQIGNLRGIALTSWRLATAEGYKHQRSDSHAFEESLAIARQIGDLRLLANILFDKAATLTVNGDYTGSKIALEESFEIREDISDAAGLINIHLQRGKIALETELFEEARKHFTKALEIAEASSQTIFLIQVHLNLAWLAIQEANVETAKAELDLVEKLYEDEDAIIIDASLLALWGHFYLKLGNHEESKNYLHRLKAAKFTNRSDIRAWIGNLENALD